MSLLFSLNSLKHCPSCYSDVHFTIFTMDLIKKKTPSLVANSIGSLNRTKCDLSVVSDDGAHALLLLAVDTDRFDF